MVTASTARRRAKADERFNVYQELVKRSKRGRIMEDVEAYKVVPTIFRGFNRATRVGGAPLSCVWLVHGPSMGGKTAFTCGLIRSFQAVGAIVAFFDAELAASTRGWFRALGIDTRRCMYYGRSDQDSKTRPEPLTYEDIVEEVDRLIGNFQDMKKEGAIRVGTPLLIIVDSLSKMVPKSMLKAIEKEEGGDQMRKGIGRLQAAMNTAWMLGLGPRVGDDDIVFAAIAHEYEVANNGGLYAEMKVRGGNALVYDSMMQVRITFGGLVRDLAAEGSPAVGKRHRVKILKNKHGPAFGESVFYTASGDGMSPIGFDRPRELVHDAMIRGLIARPKDITLTAGSTFEFQGNKYRVKDLYNDSSEPMLLELEAALDVLEAA